MLNLDSFQDYIYRVGRTARAGRSGVAVSLLTQYELDPYFKIENLLGKKLPKFPAEKERAVVLCERVREPKRIAEMRIKDSIGKKRMETVPDEDKDEIAKYLDHMKGSYVKRRKKKRAIALQVEFS
ncbi:DEAD-box ATP-dependent RNA helicase 10-like protein [Drosera capensis]